jgi:hypothetical protein
MRSSIVGFLAAALVTSVALSARAQDTDRASWAVRLDSGVASGGNHLQSGGPDEGTPPPIYLGLDVERRVTRLLFCEATVSVGLPLGWIYGATLDVALLQNRRFRVAVGAGPLIMHSPTDIGFGWGALAQAALGGELRFENGLLVATGITGAVALHHAGSGHCGADTCDASMSPGDLLFEGRVGVGFAF